MDFGKILQTSRLDQLQLVLPPMEERTVERLGQVKTHPIQSETQVYVGCPIWGKKEWVGKVYPPKTPSRDFLKYYAQQFNTIELNTTFYQIPDSSLVEGWQKVVPPEFKFSPKFFQGISRFEVLKDIPMLTHRFCEAVSGFGKNLGVSFLQLPPSFETKHLVILKRFFKLLPPGFQLSIEFRHPEWFIQNRLIDPAYDLLTENGVGTVITDVAGRRDVLHGSLTHQTAMIRFVGNSLHPTDWVRLDDWVQRLGEWFQLGIKQVYFFVHQPEEEGALELIDHFVTEMNQRYKLKIQNWDPTLGHPQAELFG